MTSPALERALGFAARIHHAQLRKGTQIPYISHLLSVAALVMEYGGSELQTIAALLHDAAEDQGGKKMLDQIQSEFGPAVMTMVEALSDSLEPEGQEKSDWRSRKQAYLNKLPQESQEVLLVSACDKLHNCRSIVAELRYTEGNLWAKFKGGKDGTLWYYKELTEIFLRSSLPSALVQEIKATVREMQERSAGSGGL